MTFLRPAHQQQVEVKVGSSGKADIPFHFQRAHARGFGKTLRLQLKAQAPPLQGTRAP